MVKAFTSQLGGLGHIFQLWSKIQPAAAHKEGPHCFLPHKPTYDTEWSSETQEAIAYESRVSLCA